MMAKLYLMASHGYPPGPGLVFHQLKDYQPYLLSQGMRLNSRTLKPHQHEDAWRPMNGFCESNHFGHVDSTARKPVLIDVQDTHPDSVLFSFGIAEQCTRQEKILQFLMSGSSDLEKGELDLSLLSDLMGLQAMNFDVHRQQHTPLINPSGEYGGPKPLVDFVGDMIRCSKITVDSDGRVMLSASGTEIKDILNIVAEFYLSNNSIKGSGKPLLVPHFSRIDTSEVQATTLLRSSLDVKDVATAPLKSPEKIKIKQLSKKKNQKGYRERDLYKRNYFHACECLLSLMMDKKQNGKTAFLSLKKSGPELPELLTQFATGIAGTGIAVLFSVICKLACGRVPFCASRLLSTGFGFGLVWLSSAVNRLGDTIVQISKNASKQGMKDEDVMTSVNKSLNEIYFRAATLMAVAVLRLA